MDDRAEAIQQIPSALTTLVLEADFAAEPDDLFGWWVEPARLTQWWPRTAEVEARLGGTYHFAWPRMDWHLRGSYTAWQPGAALAFTWHWDHEPERPTRTVTLAFATPAAGGTRLTLTHGPYTQSTADQSDRQGHITGWQQFLLQLQRESRTTHE